MRAFFDAIYRWIGFGAENGAWILASFLGVVGFFCVFAFALKLGQKNRRWAAMWGALCILELLFSLGNLFAALLMAGMNESNSLGFVIVVVAGHIFKYRFALEWGFASAGSTKA